MANLIQRLNPHTKLWDRIDENSGAVLSSWPKPHPNIAIETGASPYRNEPRPLARRKPEPSDPLKAWRK